MLKHFLLFIACGLEKEGDGESRDTQREDQYTDCLTASEQEIVKNLESLIKAKIEGKKKSASCQCCHY